MKRQRATLTLIDTENGYSATVQYQPSLKEREVQSSAVNAMIRLCVMLSRHRKELGAPFSKKDALVVNDTKKTLTTWQKVRDFIFS